MQLFLDCDGVLADFDHRVEELLGAPPKRAIDKLGLPQFWARLAEVPDFYATLPLMPDGRELFDAVAHLRPTILTGLPLGTWAAPQKLKWAEKHFPGTPVITCMARDKYKYMKPGDVLVDDRADHRAKWEDAGGIFIHHENAWASLDELARIFPSVKVPA